ncbi:MAG: hypothetical protein KJ601_02505, partial [Nanoarchaeota archaeon]|nr:hypothetical protein [Nanoarchaeota archaeon]
IFEGAVSCSYTAATEPIVELIYDRFFYPTILLRDIRNIEPNPRKGDNYYAVVYLQVEKSYIKQTWWGRLIGMGLEQTDWETFERTAPPAYVFVTRYDNVDNVGCEVLQG